ncbi:MAG: hypothetical protein BWZ02_02479 [Lentisphaerae bacterium ADurb.BinA184]|nr:MAG: hypothetical protein BWZ02_02479 [Lentisphaerae bacterium ADurb.BinA184]
MFNGRSGTMYPSRDYAGKAKPLFHCPVFATGPFDGRDNYLAAHGGMKSFRNRLTWPMTGGGGRHNHYLSQSIGWSDGHAGLYDQPAGNSAYYVNYDGDIVKSADSMGFDVPSKF